VDKVFVDKIFKIGLLALGTIFLFIYALQCQNGRYQSHNTISQVMILDTTNAELYVYSKTKEEWFKRNPIAELSEQDKAKK
jgi:hypothetical protein